MSSYPARLHVPGQTKLPLSVEIDITDEMVLVTSGNKTLAEWSLHELTVSRHSDGLHVMVENEEVVLSTPDLAKLAGALRAKDAERATSNGRPTGRTLNRAAMLETRNGEMRERVEMVTKALNSDLVNPAEAFGMWLKLLRELNHRHGHGAISSEHFYELNTRMLDLIPVPMMGSDEE
jgi:hypothetical protein